MFKVLAAYRFPPMCIIPAAFVFKSWLERIVCWSGVRVSLPSSTFSPETFQRLCNPADRPASSAQNKTWAKKKMSSFYWFFFAFGKCLFPASFSCQDVGSPWCPAEVPQPKVRVNLSVSQDNNICESSIYGAIQGCVVHPHGFLELLRWFQEALDLLCDTNLLRFQMRPHFGLKIAAQVAILQWFHKQYCQCLE